MPNTTTIVNPLEFSVVIHANNKDKYHQVLALQHQFSMQNIMRSAEQLRIIDLKNNDIQIECVDRDLYLDICDFLNSHHTEYKTSI